MALGKRCFGGCLHSCERNGGGHPSAADVVETPDLHVGGASENRRQAKTRMMREASQRHISPRTLSLNSGAGCQNLGTPVLSQRSVPPQQSASQCAGASQQSAPTQQTREWMQSRLAMLHGRGCWTHDREQFIATLDWRTKKEVTRRNEGGRAKGWTPWDWGLVDFAGVNWSLAIEWSSCEMHKYFKHVLQTVGLTHIYMTYLCCLGPPRHVKTLTSTKEMTMTRKQPVSCIIMKMKLNGTRHISATWG